MSLNPNRRFAHSPFRRSATPRAVTLLELLLALSIVAVLSTAVAAMLVGAGDTNQFVNDSNDATSQVENAYRRILHNVRTAQSLSNPSDTTVHTPGTLTIKTQNDAANGYASGATVTYSVSGGNLVENDQRWGTNTLVPNVATFSVQKISSTTPTQISITITSGGSAPVTRTAIITCRNF